MAGNIYHDIIRFIAEQPQQAGENSLEPTALRSRRQDPSGLQAPYFSLKTLAFLLEVHSILPEIMKFGLSFFNGAVGAFGFFSLTASKTESRESTTENPRLLTSDVARALAARGVADRTHPCFFKVSL